jgi:hypothetical protein
MEKEILTFITNENIFCNTANQQNLMLDISLRSTALLLLIQELKILLQALLTSQIKFDLTRYFSSVFFK